MARATRIIKRVNREPLTKKALGAIETYVYLNGDAFSVISLGVRWTLEAERMPRERLYKWLEDRAYRWKDGQWRLKRGMR
jgi:hypothetical protein